MAEHWPYDAWGEDLCTDDPRKAMHVARERSVHEGEATDPQNYK